MILKELLKYDFAKDFVEGKIKEHRFLSELIDKIKSDEEFRKKTQIFSTELEDLRKVADNLKIIKAKREETKIKSRRGFLKTSATTAAGVFALKIKALAQEKIDARKLFEEISKIPQLQPSTFAFYGGVDFSTIILIEDIHGGRYRNTGWQIEYVQLLLLKKHFGLNFVGIEGWAGHEVDKKRGVRILNGEDILIGVLIKNKNYNVIGLEDENAQRYHDISELPRLYDQLHLEYNKILEILKDFEIRKDIFDEIIKYFHDSHEEFNVQDALQNHNLVLYKIDTQCIAYFYKKTNLPTHEKALAELREANNALKKWNVDMDIFRKSGLIEEKRAEMFAKYDKISASVGIASERLLKIDSLDSQILTYLATLSNIYQALHLAFLVTKFNDYNLKIYEPEARRFYQILVDSKPQNISMHDYYVLDLRNRLATEKMLKSMRDYNQNIGIVVFGKGHTVGLINEFKRQTESKINIIVLIKPDR